MSLSNFSLSQVQKDKHFQEGVATIWLLSSLGGPSSLDSRRKSELRGTTASASSIVKKKDIINVSIPDTCTIIQKNEMQLPLRYISNLLYGVAVCYNRKTEYVLSDLTSLLTQLQKKVYSSQGAASQRNQPNSNPTLLLKTILGPNGRDEGGSGLLDDDPKFDITHVSNFDQILGMVPKEKYSGVITIRKQDYLKELTNSNIFDRISHAEDSNSLEHLNRSITLDSMPYDVDFNLDIDDIVSHQGTVTHTYSAGNNENYSVNLNNQEFTLNFDDDDAETRESNFSSEAIAAINVPLGLPNEDENCNDFLEDEHDEAGPALKKFKKGNVSRSANIIPKLIQYDEKTGLSTEILRLNHSNYCDIMDSKRKVTESKLPFTSWRQILNLEQQPAFMQKCWGIIINENETSNLGFSSNKSDYNSNSIERGRKWSSSNSNSERSTSNVPSEELGRRMSFEREESFDYNNDNILLNLDQIGEDLEDDSSRTTSAHQHDFMQMNLDLPPSSFGRTYTRNDTISDTMRSAVSAGERDAVDILYQRTNRGTHKRTHAQKSPNIAGTSELSENSLLVHTPVSAQPSFQVMLDHQARKFYEYIKERSLIVGKTTRSNPPFKKKILFEDIVPSHLTTDVDDTDPPRSDETSRISKRIAANAFLSLLNLASKELIDIKGYHEKEALDHFRIMKSDDIVMYV